MAQYLGRSSGGRGVESELSTAQPRKRKGSFWCRLPGRGKWSLKEEWHVAPIKGNGWVHSFGTSCMTISCAWPICWTSIIGFTDDALVVCATDDVRILELRINISYIRTKIVLREHEIEWKKSIKYLGVLLDRRISFSEHLQIATAKPIPCPAHAQHWWSQGS